MINNYEFEHAQRAFSKVLFVLGNLEGSRQIERAREFWGADCEQCKEIQVTSGLQRCVEGCLLEPSVPFLAPVLCCFRLLFPLARFVLPK